MISEFELTAHDKASSLWLRLRAHMEDRLADLRQRNDAQLSEMATATLRGEIKCLRALIRLEEVRPIVTGDEQPPV